MCPNIKLTVQFVHQTKSAILCAMCQKFFSNTQMACTCMQFLCQYMHTVLVVSTDGGKKKNSVYWSDIVLILILLPWIRFSQLEKEGREKIGVYITKAKAQKKKLKTGEGKYKSGTSIDIFE